MVAQSIYSRSLISHEFLINEDDGEHRYVIEGTNQHQVVTVDDRTPRITILESGIFEKIKKKYESHVTLFGGKTPDGKTHQPLIYLAKSDSEAKKMMNDSKPVVTEKEMATKSKGVEDLK